MVGRLSPRGRLAQVPLVGADGQEFVHSMLSSTDPTTAIKGVQTRGALAVRAELKSKLS